MKRPTLKTISELSGMAVPTVSRALNDAPDIGDNTKEKVRRIAREIGYVPNRAGVRLKTGKTNVISLILSTEHDVMNHTARLISSIAASLRTTRYHVVITPYFTSEDPLVPVRYVVENQTADAIIINQIEPNDPRIRYLLDREFAFATHGRSIWSDRHPYFDFDNCEFGRLATERLYASGRRNVLLIPPPLSQSYAQHMREGVRASADRLGIAVSELREATSDSATAQICSAVKTAVLAQPDIDGVVCASTTSVMAAVAQLETMGRVIGKDVDVAAKEGTPFLNLFRPPIFSIAEDVTAAGHFLAHAAIQAVEKPELPPMQKLDRPQEKDFQNGAAVVTA